MKTIKSVEVTICDKCGFPAAYTSPCVSCGIDICCYCIKAHGKVYSHGVNFSGSLDGRYCTACDAKLTKEGTDALHNAYLKINELRAERAAWDVSYASRVKVAENELEELARAGRVGH